MKTLPVVALLACGVCASAAARAAPPSPSPSVVAVLRVDVDGDGRLDLVATRPGAVIVSTVEGTWTAPSSGRLDGAIRVPGVSGALLLLRVESGRDGFLDGVYRASRGRLERLHVSGGAGDGLATAVLGRTYVDVDCGPRRRSVTQVELAPLGRLWRRIELVFALRGDRLVRVGASRHVVGAAAATHRRCTVLRR